MSFGGSIGLVGSLVPVQFLGSRERCRLSRRSEVEVFMVDGRVDDGSGRVGGVGKR
jgi:hypothetical protein